MVPVGTLVIRDTAAASMPSTGLPFILKIRIHRAVYIILLFFPLVKKKQLCYISHTMQGNGEFQNVAENETGRQPYTIPQAARKLGMTEHAIRSAARRGDLPAFKLGRDWRILPEKVDSLVSGQVA